MGTKWEIKFNDGYTGTYDAEKYSYIIDQTLNETRQLYPFRGDSKEYSVLFHAAEEVAKVPGLICEIGLRQGGGFKSILDALILADKPRTIISIDPFGGIPFMGMEGELKETTEYSNAMQKETLETVYRFLQAYPKINFVFFPLEDIEFFKRYGDGVPVYANHKKEICNTYALVHFDGPHSTDAVMTETGWFINKTVPGSHFVYDDVTHFYDHDKVKKYLEQRGWEMLVMNEIKSVFKRVK